MPIKQSGIWIADLNPQIGTEPGKTRPVLTVQTDLLNKATHPSTIVCPISTNVKKGSDILRVHLKKGMADLHQDCDIMIDQIRVIDNKRLNNKIGNLPIDLIDKVKENLRITLDLDYFLNHSGLYKLLGNQTVKNIHSSPRAFIFINAFSHNGECKDISTLSNGPASMDNLVVLPSSVSL